MLNKSNPMRFKLLLFLFTALAALTAFFVVGPRRKHLPVGEASPVAQTLTAPSASAAQDNAPPRAAKPNILARKEWKGKDPIGEMKHHTPNHITIHHTASNQKINESIEQKMRSLQSFSQSQSKLETGRIKPAWPDVPYHFYISADGRIAEGRDLRFAGDTNTDYDPTGHILLVLEGNFEKEKPTTAQLESLHRLLTWLTENWHIPASEIKGHLDYASTACPGKYLESEIPRLQKIIAKETSNSLKP
jgi:hypothetical protein